MFKILCKDSYTDVKLTLLKTRISHTQPMPQTAPNKKRQMK